MTEQPMAIEVAVTPNGKVSVNIQHLPVGQDGWGHLTFDVQEAVSFIIALQEATRVVMSMSMSETGKVN